MEERVLKRSTMVEVTQVEHYGRSSIGGSGTMEHIKGMEHLSDDPWADRLG